LSASKWRLSRDIKAKKKNSKKITTEHAQTVGHNQRPNWEKLGIQEGEEVPFKGRNNIFNKIRTGNFPILWHRGASRQRRLLNYQKGKIRKMKHSKTYYG
jgi:hypothetical protein